MAEQPSPLPTDYLLAQVSALRDEIGQRSDHQHTLLNLDTTGVATIARFVLADSSGNGRACLRNRSPRRCSAERRARSGT